MPIYRYVPILRSKAGEAVALEHLVAAERTRLLPLIQLGEKLPAAFGPRMGTTWAKLPLALDGNFHLGLGNPAKNYADLFQTLGTAGALIIPSIPCNASGSYLSLASALVGKFAPGLVVTVPPSLLPIVSAWIASQGWKHNDVDLVINVGAIGTLSVSLLTPVIINAINTYIPSPSPYRSLSLASSAAPKDFGGLSNGVNHIPRGDWQLWQAVSSAVSVKLDYSDYGVASPDLAEPPGAAMAKATVSVRYSLDTEWVFIKGNPISGKSGKPMASQYTAHAKILAALPHFGKLSACWGDTRIQQIATGGKSGSRQSWVEIATNRHLSLVANKLP